MKNIKKSFAILLATLVISCNNEIKQEAVETKPIPFLNLKIDVPANWKIEKLSSSETAEIGFPKKGGTESLMLIEEIKSDTCICEPAVIAKQVESKKGYKLIENITLKNGAGITYEFAKGKDGSKISKSYWFVIKANGKCYSVKNKIYNDELEFFSFEKSAIESIK